MKRSGLRSSLASICAAVISVAFLYPFVWMALSAFKTNREIFDTEVVLPSEWRWEYFAEIFSGEYFDFWRALGNSAGLAALQASGATAFAAAAGFALGTSRFTGRAALRLAGIASILLPAQALALPMFVWMNRIGLFDSIIGLAAIGMANGVGLLYFERVFRQMPNELIELGRIEGASEARLFWIMAPLARPHAIAFAFVAFALAWQAGLLQILLLHNDEKRTLVLWLGAQFGSGMRPPVASLMAGCTIILLVIGLVFAVAFPSMRSALRDFLK